MHKSSHMSKSEGDIKMNAQMNSERTSQNSGTMPRRIQGSDANSTDSDNANRRQNNETGTSMDRITSQDSQMPMDRTTPRTGMSMDRTTPRTGMPMEGTTPRTGMPMDGTTPRTGMPMNGTTPRTSMPMDRTTPRTGMPMDGTTPRTGMPMDRTTPRTGMPMDGTTPRTGIPMDRTTPRTGMPMDRTAPRSGMPMDRTTPRTGMPMDGTTPRTGMPQGINYPMNRNMMPRTIPYYPSNDMPMPSNTPYNTPMGVPLYPLYGYDNCEDLDKDMNYFKQLYPNTAKRIQREIDNECDKLEYDGSVMFDEYPDKVALDRIIDRVYERVKDLDEMSQVEINSFYRAPRRRQNLLRDIVSIILLNEIFNRRRRYRSRRRWF